MNLHPAHIYSPLRPVDLVGPLSCLLPPTAQEVIRAIGYEPARLLLNRWAGAYICVPPSQRYASSARRWAILSEVIGEQAMARLAATYGSHILAVPLCQDLRVARRNAALIAEFDRLSADGLSKLAAIEELCMAFSPIGARHVQAVLDGGFATPSDTSAALQRDLFAVFNPNPSTSPSSFSSSESTSHE